MAACTTALLSCLVALGAPTALGAAAPTQPPCSRTWGLSSQEEVRELADSNCVVLDGDLAISSGVRDLRPLAGLRAINGTLVVSGTYELRSLDGLESLEALGRFPRPGMLLLTFNQALESIAALRRLRVLPDLQVLENPSLQTLDGLENVSRIDVENPIPPKMIIGGNRALRSLSALGGARGSLMHLVISGNPQLASLDGLQGISGVTALLEVRNLARLESLRPLARVRSEGDVSVSVSNNPRLLSMDGLGGLTRCSSLTVRGNAQLRSLLGLRGLGGHVGSVEISWNQRLPSLRGLEGVTSGGDLSIVGNAELRSLAALIGVRGVLDGALTITSNPQLRSLHGLQHITGVHVEEYARCVRVDSNSRLESVEAILQVFSSATVDRCDIEFRQQRPLASLQVAHVDAHAVVRLRLSPSPRCFPRHAWKVLDRISRRDLSNSALPVPQWDEARCRECKPCGVWGGLPVPCDFGSGRCRCPLGRQGANCTSPAPRLRVAPGQRFFCAQPDDLAAIECSVRIALRREGWLGAPLPSVPGDRPDVLGVYAAAGGALSMSEGNRSSHRAVWANETHGSISISLWSRFTGSPAALELRVGYLPDVQPAYLIEGTLPSPSPALENTIFPWCVDSEDCSLTAPQRIEVLRCPQGWVSDDGASCARCPVGRRSANGRCGWDWALLLGTGGAFAVLLAGLLVLVAEVEAVGLQVLVEGLRSRRIPVHDVRSEGGRVVLTSWGKHGLRMGLAKSFHVRLSETGHPGLDSPEQALRARVVAPDQLELLSAQGEPLRNLDASQGFLQLPLRSTPTHTGWPVPVAFSGPALLAASACWLAWLCACRPGDDSCAPAWWAPSVVGAALAVSAIRLQLRGRRSVPTPLLKRREAYDARRSKGSSVLVARGAERAISAGQLVDLHDYFKEFVSDRDMYYVVANIVKPLTAESRLSFAEYVGPSRLAWFASHFWGTGFRHFCASIQRHAEAVGDWERQSYWICSFSINQHAVAEEIGADHRDSSFFLALQSGSCRGTCMVIDEQALPLTRSWCLFELLQTIELEGQGTGGFEGLFFCTSSGVLNSGRASVETSMALGRRLAALRLEDAAASVEADKAMIDDLVVNTMGGFDAMNRALRGRISAALRASKERALNDFEMLEKQLTS